ncbi:MAG: MOP flippase family protein [Candidatus Sericytochromatia bacterium]
MSSLTERSLSGIRWTALSQFAAQGAQYGSFILLARLLSPEDFGTVAAATLIVGLAALLNELGLGAALIQRAELRPGHLNACFIANLATGLALWAILALASGPIATFFDNAAVAPILLWLGAGFPLVGLAVVPKSMLERQLRFKAVGAVDAAAAIATAAVAIGFALSGAGAWSLVYGTLTGYAVQLVGFWGAARWVPGLRCGRQDFAELLSFGANVLGTRMLGYVGTNIDYMVIGRVLGPTALGAYSLAYKLVTWPMFKISHVILRVVFPAFARVQNDDATFRRHYTRLVGAISLVIFPLLGGLAVLAPEVIPLVFGEKWQSVVLPTQILCVTGAFKAMVCSVGTVYLSKGRPDLELKVNMIGMSVLACCVLVGVQWGVAGVAAGVLASSFFGAPLQQIVANRLIGLSMRDYLGSVAVPAGATLAMVALLLGWRQVAIGWGLPDWGLLAVAVPLGAAAYLATVSALGYDWLALVRQVAGKRPAKQAA